MPAILRWLLTQATRGVLGQIIKSVLEKLGVWKFVVAVPIAVSVAVKAMAEGSQSVAVVLMFGMAAFVLVLLHYLTLLYERIREKYFGGAFAAKRRQIAISEIATLTADEQAALRQMLITGRPKNLSDQIWQSLEMKTSFVERDFTGPKGIKNEFRPVLEEVLGPNREPIILAELEMTVAKIGDFTPVCSIRITNTGPPLESKCVVQVEKHGLRIHMPDPLVVRTEGQIRNDRTGPFSLRAGQPKLVPIFFRDPGRINEFRFIGEDKNHYSFIGDSAEFEVAIYGAEHPTRVSVRLNVGEDWKIHAEMEYC